MKKCVRILAAVLILAMTVTAVATVASAANVKTGTNLYLTVTTGKAPWYAFFLKPTVTIKNNGSNPMTINVENSKGQIIESISSLKGGKSVTVKLKANSTYTIYWGGNAWGGSIYADGTISAGRYIKGIN